MCDIADGIVLRWQPGSSIYSTMSLRSTDVTSSLSECQKSYLFPSLADLDHSMQNYHNFVHCEEEREMHPYCDFAGVGLILWSPLATGILARLWSQLTAAKRAQENQAHHSYIRRKTKLSLTVQMHRCSRPLKKVRKSDQLIHPLSPKPSSATSPAPPSTPQ